MYTYCVSIRKNTNVHQTKKISSFNQSKYVLQCDKTNDSNELTPIKEINQIELKEGPLQKSLGLTQMRNCFLNIWWNLNQSLSLETFISINLVIYDVNYPKEDNRTYLNG